MHIIEIKDMDNDTNVLSVRLDHILDLLEPEGRQLKWSILDLYAEGDLGEGRSMLDLEKKIQESPEGFSLSWDELISFGQAVSQIIDTVIVGYKKSNYVPRLGPESPIGKLYEFCDLVIELIDSSVWRICAKENRIIKKFEKTLRGVHVMEERDD